MDMHSIQFAYRLSNICTVQTYVGAEYSQYMHCQRRKRVYNIYTLRDILYVQYILSKTYAVCMQARGNTLVDQKVNGVNYFIRSSILIYYCILCFFL